MSTNNEQCCQCQSEIDLLKSSVSELTSRDQLILSNLDQMAIANFLVKVSLENLVIDYTAFCDAVMVSLEKIVSPRDFDFAQFKEVFEAATKSRDEAQAKLNEVVEEVAKKLRAATPASLDGSQLSLNLPDAVQETEQTPGE